MKIEIKAPWRKYECLMQVDKKKLIDIFGLEFYFGHERTSNGDSRATCSIDTKNYKIEKIK